MFSTWGANTNEVAETSDIGKESNGRALILSWTDELSPELDAHLDNLSRIFQDDYCYTVERLSLTGSAEHAIEDEDIRSSSPS